MESHARSLIKALIWNLIGFVSMMLVGLATTGSWAVGLTTAAVNVCLGFTLYFVYERFWSTVRWGLLDG